jgi:hypothetical protein
MELFLIDRGQLASRKFRLFGCACLRDVWDILPTDVLRQAIVTCERFADGLATAKELKKARDRADRTYEGMGDIVEDHSAIAVTALCEATPSFPMGEGSASGISAVAAEARSNKKTSWSAARKQARHLHAQLFRDIFGNPFRPVAVDPAWRTSTVLALAQGIYDERAFDRMPILADALQDAGCDSEDVLTHCRGPGPHVRGCWVVDLLLGKE